MSQLILLHNLEHIQDSEDEDPHEREDINNLNNYKGIFVDEESEEEQRYFEFGAHFSYKWLCHRLEELSRALTHENNSMDETGMKNDTTTANDKEVNFRRISTKDTKQSVGNERRGSGKKNNPGSNYSNNNNNQSNNFNRRFLFPKEAVNKIPSVSLLNNASMSNVLENNILTILNDNLNNNHKSRNINKADNVYNNETVVPHDPPMRILNKEDEFVNCPDDRVLLKNNLQDVSKLKTDQNKHVTTTFKKDEKNQNLNDNLHAFTSYTNAVKKNENGYKVLIEKKKVNMFIENKNIKNTQNNPIVIVEKRTEENKIKSKYDNFFNSSSNNSKQINSLSKEKKFVPVKDNHIINTYINKLNVNNKSNDGSKLNIIMACNTKLGRNVNKSKLNPHNTNVSQTKTQTIQAKQTMQIINVNKTKDENSQLKKFKQEIKKLNFEKILKLNECQYITATVENKNNPNSGYKNKNYKLEQKSISPGKILIETNRLAKCEKENTKSISHDEVKSDQFNSNIIEESDKIKRDIGLTEIMSTLTKNNETKSRNAQRSQIAVTTSNLFSSDKAQSMQNVSYQKTDILSTKKNITQMKPYVNNYIPKTKPKTIAVVNKSFTSHMNLKPNNKKEINSSINNLTAKKKVNNITIWSVAENKKIQVKFGTVNANMNTYSNDLFNSKEKKENKIENVRMMKNTNAKSNNNFKPGENSEVRSPLQKKLTSAENTNLKNKSNSLNTNLDLGKGIGISLIKNYKLNNNPTKISYNLKKNESSGAKSIYVSNGSKKNSFGLINILSTKSNKL